MYRDPAYGRLEAITGCMFSGKSEELHRRIRRALYARRSVQLFLPELEGRPAEDEGPERTPDRGELAIAVVDSIDDLVGRMDEGVDVIALDEAHFYDPDALVERADRWADYGRRVLVAGLDLDFRGRPFRGMARLMACAERVEKLQAVCVQCGDAGTRTQRLVEGRPANPEDPLIKVTDDAVYEARCRACHLVPEPDSG